LQTLQKRIYVKKKSNDLVNNRKIIFTGDKIHLNPRGIMEGFVLFEKGPEESYSRHLDKEVAADEHPYGYDYKLGFQENRQGIRKGMLNSVDRLKGGY